MTAAAPFSAAAVPAAHVAAGAAAAPFSAAGPGATAAPGAPRRRLRIAHLVTRLDLGGAQQNTLYTVEHLDPGRFDVFLGAGPGGLLDAEARDASNRRARPFLLRFFENLVRELHPLRDLAALLQLRQYLVDAAPDVVHTHSSKAGILGRVAARLAGVPGVVHTYHGFGFHDRQHPLVLGFYVALERFCCAISDRIIFVSEDNRRTARRHRLTRSSQEVLIRSGVRIADYPARLASKEAKKAELGCRMHRPLVVSVGNLKPQKNPEGFLRVAERCLVQAPDSSWVFVGEGELRPRVEARVLAGGLHGKVFFPGWRRDTAEILAAADVFVLTSLWEGLPRSLVEAMRTGLPCVCYATDGVRDLLRDGENGYLVAPGDEAGLADRVAGLLRDPGMAKRMGARAADSIGIEFDIDHMVRQQEALYVELAAEAGAFED